MNIFVVEDDVFAGAMLVDVLRLQHHQVELASSIDLGFLALTSTKISVDLLVLDAVIGTSSCEELIARLRGGNHAIPPVVLLSGETPEFLHALAARIGAIAILHKPLRLQTLIGAIELIRQPEA